MNMLKNYSPFRYPGGKFYARKIILERIPSHETYVETFVGGGQIYFSKENAERSLLNDIDQDLIATYTIIRDHPLELIKKLQSEPINRARHHFYKKMQPTSDLERATRWFYLNRTSFSGILSQKSCYLGYTEGISIPPKKWGKLINNACVKLRNNTEITCLDFEEAIAQYSEGTFAFIDPPYFNASRSLYNHEFDPQDHERLARVLFDNRYKFKFLLTYDVAPEITNLYSWASINKHSWRYSINYEANNGEQATELFIDNYHLV